MAMVDRLAAFSEAPDRLTCSYLSTAHLQTAAQIREWMLAAGLSVEIDAIGNVVGRWRSSDPHARTLMTGSHYDTVINAGRYDGRLGIVLPIVVAAQLRQAGKQAAVRSGNRRVRRRGRRALQVDVPRQQRRGRHFRSCVADATGCTRRVDARAHA